MWPFNHLADLFVGLELDTHTDTEAESDSQSDSESKPEPDSKSEQPARRPDTPSGWVGWGTMEDPDGGPIFRYPTPDWMYEDFPPPSSWWAKVWLRTTTLPSD